MTTTGNPSHLRVARYGNHTPDRGKLLDVGGWQISEITYRLLVSRFGQGFADWNCRVLAEKQAART